MIIKIYAHLLLPSRCVLIDCNNILSTHPSGIYIIFDNRRTVYIIYPFSLSQFDILFFYLVKGFPLLCKVLRTLDNIKTIILYGFKEKGIFIFTQCVNDRLYVYKYTNCDFLSYSVCPPLQIVRTSDGETDFVLYLYIFIVLYNII